MDTVEIIIHASDFSDEMKKSLYEYVEKNLSGKLDSYIKKHEKPNSPVRVDLTVKKKKMVNIKERSSSPYDRNLIDQSAKTSRNSMIS